jgi:uncharacterized protein YpuA (DUF1002 family)
MKHLKMFGITALAAMALMAVVGAGTASAVTLYIGGVAQNKAVTIESSLASGSTAVLKDEGGTTTDTCNISAVKGSTQNNIEGSTKFTEGLVVGGAVTTLSFSGCSHTTKVIKNGSLHIDEKGNVISIGAEVTVVSTAFGISAICKTGTGTKIGTFSGTNDTTKHATITIDATNSLNCGILGNSSWTGTYTVTSPTGLNVGA